MTQAVEVQDVRPPSDQAFKAKYKAYLQTPLWKRRRDLVMKRCGGVCEGCGTRRATEVHHVTYQHVFRELLFELRGLCAGCHEICHDDHSVKDPLMPALDSRVSPAMRLRQASPVNGGAKPGQWGGVKVGQVRWFSAPVERRCAEPCVAQRIAAG